MPLKDIEAKKAYAKAYREKYKVKQAAYMKQYYLEHKVEAIKYKSKWSKDKRYTKYGITALQFDTNLDRQNWKCAICSKDFTETHRVYIDHCHTTGKVRGLVCFHCNTGLGHFKDNPILLKKAINYLNDNPFNHS